MPSLGPGLGSGSGLVGVGRPQIGGCGPDFDNKMWCTYAMKLGARHSVYPTKITARLSESQSKEWKTLRWGRGRSTARLGCENKLFGLCPQTFLCSLIADDGSAEPPAVEWCN